MKNQMKRNAMAVLAMASTLAFVGTAMAEDQFPIIISHALGETVIEEAPEAVATIGWGNLDVPLALGIAPVGVSKATYGATDDNGLFYWTNEAFAELGVDEPNVFDDTDGLDFEAINNAEPNLILAVYSGITQEDYEQLSEIAPTVPYATEAWATTWQDLTIDNGKALGSLSYCQGNRSERTKRRILSGRRVSCELVCRSSRGACHAAGIR